MLEIKCVRELKKSNFLELLSRPWTQTDKLNEIYIRKYIYNGKKYVFSIGTTQEINGTDDYHNNQRFCAMFRWDMIRIDISVCYTYVHSYMSHIILVV